MREYFQVTRDSEKRFLYLQTSKLVYSGGLKK